jgi:predicted 3-demethylubiquinone-9 3-methyltransferase (glyoxalase superfamily)
MKQKITPFLWFNGQAEEAARFYVSVFPDSRIGELRRWGEAGPGPKGGVMSATFELEGQEFIALNGGPQFQFTPAISLFVDCRSQAEADELWQRLSADGEQLPCGWLRDRFGVSWQIIPSRLGELLGDRDPAKAAKAMRAMLQMRRIDVAALEKACRE